MTTRAQIIEAARTYLGVPFRHQGRSRQGVDCIGMVVLPCRDCGHELPDCTNYSLRATETSLLEALGRVGFERWPGEPEPGHLVVLQYGRVPQHVAWRTDRGLLHVFRDPPSKVVEHGLVKDWPRPIITAYRLPFLED